MLSLTAGQQAVVDSPVKSVSWLFDVVDKNLVSYRWSTKLAVDTGYSGVLTEIGSDGVYADPAVDGVLTGMTYAFKIVNFSGVSLSRPRTESGIMPPSELTFSVINKDNVYNADDFDDGYVTLSLHVGDVTGAETKIRSWKFLIKKVDSAYQQLDFTCEDFFQQYIEGDYPGAQYVLEDLNSAWEAGTVWEAGTAWGASATGALITFGVKVRDIFPSADGDIDDDVCLPLPFGTCYVPIRSAYIVADRYYVLGPTIANGAAVTYTISEVRTPRDYSVKVAYTSASYTFTQSTKVNADGYTFRVFQPMIAGTNPPGFTNGVFPDGDHFFDVPTKFTRSDTAAVTNPADVIEYVLKDMGVASADIDATSFAAAHATFATWGLAFNGAFWRVAPREKVLSLLLSMCHSTLIVGETLELHVLDSASKKTLTSADIIRGGDTGAGSFQHSVFTRMLADCGNVLYSPTDDAQDIGLSVLVAAKIAKSHIDSDVFSMPMVQDATIAGKVAGLYLQRKLLKKSEERFSAKGTCLAVQPSDFLTLSGSNYGGTHLVIVDSMKIGKDLAIDFVCTGFSDTIDNYV